MFFLLLRRLWQLMLTTWEFTLIPEPYDIFKLSWCPSKPESANVWHFDLNYLLVCNFLEQEVLIIEKIIPIILVFRLEGTWNSIFPGGPGGGGTLVYGA